MQYYDRRIQILSHEDELIPLKSEESTAWKSWARLFRKIYLLCDGKSSERKIAQLANTSVNTVHTTLCVLFLDGHISFLRYGENVINLPALSESFSEIRTHFFEFAHTVYTSLIEHSTRLREWYTYNIQATPHMLEQELLTILTFCLRCAKQTDSSARSTMQLFVSGYKLTTNDADELTLCCECLLAAFQQHLGSKWTTVCEHAWTELLFILKSALLGLCVSTFHDLF